MTQEIATIVRWKNGNVMVFDQNGDQIPEYQGRWNDVKYSIVRDMPDHVEIEGPKDWNRVFPKTPIIDTRVSK
ncbi:hypothetical protein LCGC14_2298160 [marine sediment metagenome]|uniref:Uncharacterized protein n=1 Tax=marine sediment metagenome TaxID=412755 RepID=A0A0F9DBT2_9ZZZZ